MRQFHQCSNTIFSICTEVQKYWNRNHNHFIIQKFNITLRPFCSIGSLSISTEWFRTSRPKLNSNHIFSSYYSRISRILFFKSVHIKCLPLSLTIVLLFSPGNHWSCLSFPCHCRQVVAGVVSYTSERSMSHNHNAQKHPDLAACFTIKDYMSVFIRSPRWASVPIEYSIN